MKNSIDIIENLSLKCVQHTTYYTFNKQIEEPEKYKKGRIDAANWIGEVLYIFMQKEKDLLKELKKVLEDKRIELVNLKDGNYKQGLFDEIKEINEILEDFK
jgi:hypothetical protein